MRQRTQRLVYTVVLLAMIGAIFFAGKPEPSSAQDAPLSQQKAPFKTYLLGVYCGSPEFPTAKFIYHVREERAMGSHEICAGKCGGGIVSLADALAQLPAEVAAAFRAQVSQHEADAAAGKGKPRLSCLKGGEKSPPEKKCEKPAPWLGSSTDCTDVQRPTTGISGADTVMVTVCGYVVFVYKPNPRMSEAGLEAYKQLVQETVKQQIGTRVCCEKLRQASRTEVPCSPGVDFDCDGKPDGADLDTTTLSNAPLPDINLFATPKGAAVDPFPEGLNPDDTDFLPPADKCDCKWELVKGTLTCSPDGRQRHVYQAHWRCPSTGNERFTRKEAAPSAPCTPPTRGG